jgi:pyrrolidone-carboxylate peptidase
MKLFFTLLLFTNFLSFYASAQQDFTLLTVEEQRLEKAAQALPHVSARFDDVVDGFSAQLQKARNFTALTQLVLLHSRKLWRLAERDFDAKQDYDDRPLYWARLKMTKALRESAAFNKLLTMQQGKLLWKFELYSRGLADVKFNKNAKKRILITGFDPFFLDKNIAQSNPSGVAALALDDLFLGNKAFSAEIETLIIPVRFADFDQGIIETMLKPYIRHNKIDMVITVSMGRSNFDLERFPGLRRSAKAPDNLNAYTGADSQHPLVPLLRGEKLKGPEFVEFSLPAKKMQQAAGDYLIKDNRQVTTLTKTFRPTSLKDLVGEISVQGSGGGYLSNEVSYRSILLRDKYAPMLAVGHIHTPKVTSYQAQTNQKIVQQIKAMLLEAIKD